MAKGKSAKGTMSGSRTAQYNPVQAGQGLINSKGQIAGKQVTTPARATATFSQPTGGAGGTSSATGSNPMLTGQPQAKAQGVNTTATQTGNTSITPSTNNPQTGGNGNATTNPYGNAFQTYKTNMEKSKNAQMGQLDTEYNRQKESIEGNANNLNRNAYVTYMQRNLANRDAISNLGIARSGAAERMNTANMADYNRSVGNVGAYRTSQLSDAENAYNQNRQNLENEYNNNLTEKEAEYENLRIGRENELADLQRNLDFTAAENAKDREQQAREAERQIEIDRQNFDLAKEESVYKRQQDRFNTFTDTVSQYDTPEKAEKAIKDLQAKEKAGKLEPWEQQFYGEMLMYLRTQKNIATQNAKKSGTAKKSTGKKSSSGKSTGKKSSGKKSSGKKSSGKKSSGKKK